MTEANFKFTKAAPAGGVQIREARNLTGKKAKRKSKPAPLQPKGCGTSD